jgi:hypothetical protein
MAQVDPKHAFKMGSMNGRKRSKAVVAPGNTPAAAVRLNHMRFGRIRPNLQQDYATPPRNLPGIVGEPYASLWQPRLSQSIRKGREVLRPADRDPVRESGDA